MLLLTYHVVILTDTSRPLSGPIMLVTYGAVVVVGSHQPPVLSPEPCKQTRLPEKALCSY